MRDCRIMEASTKKERLHKILLFAWGVLDLLRYIFKGLLMITKGAMKILEVAVSLTGPDDEEDEDGEEEKEVLKKRVGSIFD